MEESKVSIVEKPRVRRGLAFTIGAIAVLLMSILVAFMSLYTNSSLWPFHPNPFDVMNTGMERLGDFYLWPLILCLIASFIVKNGRGLNKQELTIIISMLWVSSLIPTFIGVVNAIMWIGVARQSAGFQWATLGFAAPTNYLFGPDPKNPDLWKSWMYGGPVPWDAWATPLAYFIVYPIVYYLLFMFLMGIWRRQWIDIEDLPFPIASGVASMINMTYERKGNRSAFLTNKWLWIGLIIGIIGLAPYWVNTLIPGRLKLRLDSPLTLGDPLTLDITQYNIIQWAPITFAWHPYLIGAAILIPSTTLLTYVVFTVILLWMIPPMLVAGGLWDPMKVGTPLRTVMFSMQSEPNIGPIHDAGWGAFWNGGFSFFRIGSMMALIFFPLFMYRGELVRGMRAILGKGEPEVEEKEPLKYKYLWAGYIVLLLAMSGVMLWGSGGRANPLMDIIWRLSLSCFILLMARTYAEMGAMHGLCENAWHVIYNNFQYWWAAVPSSPFYIADRANRFMTLRAELYYDYGNEGMPAPYLMEAFKIGQLTETHSRDIFIGSIIAVIVSIPTSVIFFLYWGSLVGFTNFHEYNYLGWLQNWPQRVRTYICQDPIVWKGTLKPVATEWIGFAIGAAFIIVLFVISARFPWFPFSPAGAALAWGWISPLFWLPALIGFIVKYVVTRVGGSAMYEEKLIPIAIGLIASLPLMLVLSVLSMAASYG